MLRSSRRFSVPFHLGTVAASATLAIMVTCWAFCLSGTASAEEAPPPDAAEVAEAAGNWQTTVKVIAAALAISLTAFATAITQRPIGSAGVGVLAENPKLFGSILILLVIPETMVILGFVIAALILF